MANFGNFSELRSSENANLKRQTSAYKNTTVTGVKYGFNGYFSLVLVVLDNLVVSQILMISKLLSECILNDFRYYFDPLPLGRSVRSAVKALTMLVSTWSSPMSM